jgi:hypothetical protein
MEPVRISIGDTHVVASKQLTPSERAMRARLAAHERWARTPDRAAATATARQAFLDRFDREVDPDGSMDPALRAKLADNARKAHFTRMALRSAQSRRTAA